ncbi:hypothetical protein VHEMI02807 [[Torrubiella] hemipterigena]|uniref:Uncharacterized protein n=1 Tax=[Torrubiella] hemipterigena TaxID=1531966 RepID=A0A0A1TBL1_9HYPO|nr:hypothetical protein VHEMI02807 [[Torrubiella] hemipterigena]
MYFYYGLAKTIALTQGASTLVVHMEDREDPKEVTGLGRGPISGEVNVGCHLGPSGNTTCSNKGATYRYVDDPSTIFTVEKLDEAPFTKSVGPDPCIITLIAGLEKLPVSTACALPSQTALPSAGPSSSSSGMGSPLSHPSANATSVIMTGNARPLVTPNAAAVAGLVALVGVAAL